MKVLIACEFSGIVRESFKAQGHDAWSCDLLPTEIPGQHIQGDVLKYLDDGWDLMIAHPPCTYLAVSGNKWMKSEFKSRFPNRLKDRAKAISFFIELMGANIPKIVVENPIGIMSSVVGKPGQIIQPWQFGHAETKATCLWIKGLPNLKPTNIVKLPEDKSKRMRLHYLSKTEDRWKERSRTFLGIAEAMAKQWGEVKK
jgi:site-specific DNA-cytosine methylase